MKTLLTCAVLLLSCVAWAGITPGTVFPNIDDRTNLDNGVIGWGSCSTCAGGLNSTTDFSLAFHQHKPALSPSGSLEFSINATLPFTNALWYYKLGPHNRFDDFLFDFFMTIDSQTNGSAQALEFDTFQWINGAAYVFGTQCDYSIQQWSVWDGSAWAPTGIACPAFVPGDWYRITWLLHRRDGKVRYDALAITHLQSGRKPVRTLYPVNFTGGPTAEPTPPPDNLGVQFQIDLGPNGGQGHMWVDKVSLTAFP